MKKVLLLAILALALTVGAFAQPRTTESRSHKNLTVFLIEDDHARVGRSVLTLDEAIRSRSIEVRETHSVGSVEMRNRSDKPVFVQGGEIVAGGNQDRALAMDTILPPHSDWIAVKAFCVEHNRWSARDGKTNAFDTAPNFLPSTDLRLAALVDRSQNAVWDAVRKYQAAIIAKTEGKGAASEFLSGSGSGESGNLTWTTADPGTFTAVTDSTISESPVYTQTQLDGRIILSNAAGAGISTLTLGTSSTTAGALTWTTGGNRIQYNNSTAFSGMHASKVAHPWLSAAGSSLHLTLELSPIKGETAEYLRAFDGLLANHPHVVGFAFEIHGQPLWI